MTTGFEFLEKDYLIVENFLYLFMVFSVITFILYVILSQLYLQGIYKYFSTHRANRILSTWVTAEQRNKEILMSGISSFIFGLIGVLMIMMWQYDLTAIYIEWSAYPLWYVPISALLAFFIHETYYYWLHRWLHTPKIYRLIHKVHHDSIDTSVWTSFSFHPFESLLQALIIPAIMTVVPMHIYVLIVLLIVMTISAIINHAGVEIFPRYAHKHIVWRHFIGATHHDLHHRRFLFNYGLYFTFWDRWMKTEVDNYEEIYQKVTN